jgi:hypothetical protein
LSLVGAYPSTHTHKILPLDGAYPSTHTKSCLLTVPIPAHMPANMLSVLPVQEDDRL